MVGNETPTTFPFASRKIIRENFSSHHLGSSYRPRNTPGREAELGLLRMRLQDVLKHGATGCTQLYGPSGAGKTLLARNVLHEIEEAAKSSGAGNIFPLYLDLSKMTTTNQVWAYLTAYLGQVKDLPARIAKRGISDSEYAAQFCAMLKGASAQFVLVLDELDKHQDHNGLFRWFTRFDVDNVLWAIVVIANDPLFRNKLAPEIQSSLGAPFPIEFKAYNQPELVGILQDRVDVVCKPGAVDDAVVHFISQGEARTHGDARNALELLKKTVEQAEADPTAIKVEIRHCAEAENHEDNKFMESVVLGLPLHKKFALGSIVALSLRGLPGESRWVSTKDAFTHYNAYLLEHQFTQPVKLRQFNNLVNFLNKQHSLLEATDNNRGRNGGPERLYRPTRDLPKDFMPRVLATDPYVAAMFSRA